MTSTNSNLFSPAVSEHSLQSLKDMAGSEPRFPVTMAIPMLLPQVQFVTNNED